MIHKTGNRTIAIDCLTAELLNKMTRKEKDRFDGQITPSGYPIRVSAQAVATRAIHELAKQMKVK